MDKQENLKEIVRIVRSYGDNLIKLADVLEEIIDTSKEDSHNDAN